MGMDVPVEHDTLRSPPPEMEADVPPVLSVGERARYRARHAWDHWTDEDRQQELAWVVDLERSP